ncbi:MAG: hypothetical protein EOP53_23890 [Sphingobacteriales bacterium]|nr:MAG: hypothetical protein EOP53_23890 [Sphingobacteriales bacterium]
MEDVSDRLPQQRQNSISVALILTNIFLAFVYLLCTPLREDDFFIGLLGVSILACLLQALFVFTYKGKAPLASKWILAVFVLITLCYAALVGYAMALGKAFQH